MNEAIILIKAKTSANSKLPIGGTCQRKPEQKETVQRKLPSFRDEKTV